MKSSRNQSESRGDGSGPVKERKRVPLTMISCYGYRVDDSGCLCIHPGEADVVFHIFDSFISGQSLGQIAASLAQMGVASPSGKRTWSRATISNILSNEKYVGDVMLGRSRDEDQPQSMAVQPQKLIRNHHPALISRSIFEIAQREKERRRQRRTKGRTDE